MLPLSRVTGELIVNVPAPLQPGAIVPLQSTATVIVPLPAKVPPGPTVTGGRPDSPDRRRPKNY